MIPERSINSNTKQRASGTRFHQERPTHLHYHLLHKTEVCTHISDCIVIFGTRDAASISELRISDASSVRHICLLAQENTQRAETTSCRGCVMGRKGKRVITNCFSSSFSIKPRTKTPASINHPKRETTYHSNVKLGKRF